MAHLYRPWITRWRDAEGRQVPARTPGARKTKERARKWYCKGPPLAKPVPLCADKQAAQVMMADLVRRVERGEAGLEDSVTLARRVSLETHLSDWEGSLRLAGNEPRDLGQKVRRVRSFAEALRWRTLGDLSRDQAEREAARRRALPPDDPLHIGAQTSNFYLAACSQFGRWCAESRPPRLAANPFQGWRRQNVQLDRRHDRRDLSPDELARLLAATLASGRVRRGLAGADRHALYLAACGTGFRAGALASLTPAAFRLDDTPPTVTLTARRNKSRRVKVQPLPPDLAAFMKGYLAGRPADLPVWPGTWASRAADVLAADLAEAGIPVSTTGHDGIRRFADFHALRHTYLTMVSRGTDLRTAQELAGHSSPLITARYAHRDLADQAAGAAALSLPGLGAAAEPTPTAEQLAVGYALLWTVLCAVLVIPRVAPGPGTGVAREGTERETDKT